MKNKKSLPQIITIILSAIIILYGINSPKVQPQTFPFRVFEKLGMYISGFAYGTLDNSFSFNGTHEAFLSLLKKVSINGVFSAIIPIAIFSISLILVLWYVQKGASKTEYKWTIMLSAILIPVVFCNFTNIIYFKTLYAHALVLILLLLICAMFINSYKSNVAGTTKIILLTIVTIIFGCIGVIQAICAVLFGILIIRLSKLSKTKFTKVLAVIMGIIVIIQSVIFVANFRPVDYRQNLYNSVFFGVCKYDSVTSIGLDEKLDDFKEVYYGMKEDESEYDLENTFYSKVSYPVLIKYYITHPVNTVKIINNQAKSAFYNDYKFGFAPYSYFKKLYIPSGLAAFFVIALLYIIIAIFVGKKYSDLKYVAEFYVTMAVMWFITLITTTLYHGNSDTLLNMYTFNVLFDIILVCAIVGGIRILLKSTDDKKKEFGITHE